MKRPKVLFLVMTWLFVDFAILSRPLRESAMQIYEVDTIVRQIVLLMPLVIFAILYGLFRLYVWAINLSILMFVLYFAILLINIYNNGIRNFQTGVVILVFEVFNILSVIYLIKPDNRKYFKEFVKEREQEKKFRKMARKL